MAAASDYILILISTFLLFSIFAAPLFENIGYPKLAHVFYLGFSDSCHQQDVRSFHLNGTKLAVCSRCFGIYFGLILASIFYPFIHEKNLHPRILIIFLMPLALDGTTQLLGFRQSNNTLRFITGLLFGIILPFYINPALKQVVLTIKDIYIRGKRI